MEEELQDEFICTLHSDIMCSHRERYVSARNCTVRKGASFATCPYMLVAVTINQTKKEKDESQESKQEDNP